MRTWGSVNPERWEQLLDGTAGTLLRPGDSAFEEARAKPFCSAGLSSTTGLLLDLSAMDSVAMDADRAKVSAGVRLAKLVTVLGEHGRALPTGTCPTVGRLRPRARWRLGHPGPTIRADLRPPASGRGRDG